jgi:hypothetical protein
MNFFSMERLINEIKSGRPILYYNIETTSEEMEQRFINAFHKDKKLGYKFKNGKLVSANCESN